MSGLVKVSFCDTVTGDSIGYGLVRYQDLVDCDGVITSSMVREYFDLTDVSQGAVLPAGWEVCEPSGGAGLALTDIDGNAIVTGDSISRQLQFEDGTPLSTDGSGAQILGLDCSLQKSTLAGIEQIGVSSNYVHFRGFSLVDWTEVGAFPPDSTTTSPASSPVTVINPCSDRDMEFYPTFHKWSKCNSTGLNTGVSWIYRYQYSLNGGATWITLDPLECEYFLPGTVTFGTPPNNFINYTSDTENEPNIIIPAGGSVSFIGRITREIFGRTGAPSMVMGGHINVYGFGRLT